MELAHGGLWGSVTSNAPRNSSQADEATLAAIHPSPSATITTVHAPQPLTTNHLTPNHHHHIHHHLHYHSYRYP